MIGENKNFEYYISQINKGNISFYGIKDEINDVDKMNMFLTEYETYVDNETNQNIKLEKLRIMIKFTLSFSKLEYIKHLVEKYESIKFSPYDLSIVIKNSNADVFEYYLKIMKVLSPTDIIDCCILSNGINLNILKLLLLKSNFSLDDYFMLLKIYGTQNNLECFEYIIHKTNNQLDLTQKIIAREEPLARFMDSRDYSVPVECDLLLLVSDSNSFEVVKYLLELKIFSSESISKAFEYVKSNPKLIRFRNNKFIDNKIDTLHLLFDAMDK